MWVVWFAGILCVSLADRFTEELVVSRLPTDNFLSQFRFEVSSDHLQLGDEYELFPRVLAELISRHSLKSLSLSLGQGRWFADEWGLPPQPSAPTGAYVHAWIAGNDTQVDERWEKVINALNGIVCTSLTTIVPQLTSSPRLLSAVLANGPVDGGFRYGALARETLCTENLTPWKKLLPCKQNGLSSLLNPLKLYDSNFHSMGLTVSPVCPSDGSCHWKLQLALAVVSPLLSSRTSEVDIEALFGRKVVGVCNAAHSSYVYIAANSQESGLPVVDGFIRHDMKNISTERNLRVDLSRGVRQSIVSVSSRIGGLGDYSGVLVTSLVNTGSQKRAIFTHAIPWFVKIHYHSLELRCETKPSIHQEPLIHSNSIIPAVSRKQPAVVEFDFEFPADSRCFVEFRFKKAFLRLREYPPDANHGMYIPSAMLNILGSNTEGRTTVHGNVLLVVLPVPDFSMPFNVICFVLTTISLCFGPIHNFSTKILIPLNTKLPMPPVYRKVIRAVMLVLLGLAVYAQYYEIGLNEVRRIIVRAVEDVKEGVEKMNSL